MKELELELELVLVLGLLEVVEELPRHSLRRRLPVALRQIHCLPVHLEVHDIPTVLPNMVVKTIGGTFKHACQRAAYMMMARIRELHDHNLHNTAYHYHPRHGSSADVSTFKSPSEENDTVDEKSALGQWFRNCVGAN
uniref:Uncharacterized protein n=1 Tax=Oryza sativa subsp. japonica TaxID=39947 RepID=Q6K338_ORYSJ|nr:hypothetical protein [Oryza sativa Japonica Group]